jgi:hypothetical protein
LAPLLESIFPGRWDAALLRLSELAAETETFFDAQTAPLDDEIAAARRRDALFARTLDSLNVPDAANDANNKNFPNIADAVNPANIANNASSPDVVILPLEPLRDAPEPLVRRYFRQIWRDRNWPLAAMGAAEWRRLTAAVRKTPLDRRAEPQFPGDVRLTFPDSSTLRFERRMKTAAVSSNVDSSSPFD